jgi:predicted  nucleic acid-binding Zn-ribbon protein
MPYNNPLPTYLDNVLGAARAVAVIAPDLDALPKTLKALRAEVSAIEEATALTEQSLVSERKAHTAEKHRHINALHHDYQIDEHDRRDHARHIGELKAEALRLQNLAADERRRFDKMTAEIKKFELQLAHPVAAPSPEVVPEEVKKSTETEEVKSTAKGKSNG